MSHDGLPARAGTGAREAVADRQILGSTARRRGLAAVVAISALVLAACNTPASSGGVAASTGTASTAPLTSAEPSTEPSAALPTQVQLSFQEANASKIFGGGIITDLGDGS